MAAFNLGAAGTRPVQASLFGEVAPAKAPHHRPRGRPDQERFEKNRCNGAARQRRGLTPDLNPGDRSGREGAAPAAPSASSRRRCAAGRRPSHGFGKLVFTDSLHTRPIVAAATTDSPLAQEYHRSIAGLTRSVVSSPIGETVDENLGAV